MRRAVFIVLSVVLGVSARVSAASAEQLGAVVHEPLDGWVYGDVPAWDLADEGLPFRFTLALPSRRDPISRVLFAEEARWTLSLGYAKVYNSYDTATGAFKNAGGHAVLFSAGRQFRWRVPPVAGRFTPRIAIEFGVNHATRPFPADGTRTNLKLITGLEWIWRSGPGAHEWSFAVLWPHFSNAGIFSRNAGYDGLALRLGRSVRFKKPGRRRPGPQMRARRSRALLIRRVEARPTMRYGVLPL